MTVPTIPASRTSPGDHPLRMQTTVATAARPFLPAVYWAC